MGISATERRWVAELVGQTQELEQRVASISIPSQDDVVLRIKTLSDTIREQQTRELMEQLDIRVLEPCGMVHSALYGAGYRNVAQIYNDCVSNTGTLNRLRGAKATRAAVLEIHENVFQDVPTILGLEQNSDTEDKLLSQIYLCKRFPTLRKRRQTLLDVCANTHEACKTLSDLPGFFWQHLYGQGPP